MAATWTTENGGNNSACYLLSMQNVSNGKRVRGFVSHVVDSDHFYLQFVNELPYAAMSAELQSEYDTDIMACLDIDQLREGQAYATLFNGVWFRVLLEKLLFNGNCLIFFVDSGHRKTAPLDEIFLLNPKFLKLPAQAVLCQLHGVQPVGVKDAVFQEERMLFLKSLIKNNKVIALIDNIIPGKAGRANQMEINLQVTLFTDLEEENIDGKLLSSGYYVARELEPQQNEIALVNQSTSERSVASNYGSACSTPDDPEPMETDDAHSADQLVTMCHIVDPSHFYVQRKSDENEKNKIHSLVNTYYRNINLTALNRLEIRTAEYYAILCPKSHTWYRSRCASPEDSLNGFSHDYFLIDEGYTLRIFKNSVRLLTPELRSFPPLALGCRLDLDIPEGGWTSEDVDTFKKLTEERPLKMQVLRKENDILSVDLAHVTSVAGEEAVDSVRNRLQRNRTSRTVHLSLSSLHFKFYESFSGARIRGKIIRAYNPYHFYFEPESVDIRKFSSMSAQLQVDCSVPVAATCLAVTSLKIGQGYAALRPNGRWGRAILENVVESDDLVTVLFVDYGDLCHIPRSSLRQLRERFYSFPACVVRCKLGDVGSVSRGNWTKNAIADFRDLVKGSVIVKVIKYAVYTHRKMREPVLLVKIFSSGEKSSVNSILVDMEHAAWIVPRSGRKSSSPQMKRVLPPRMRHHTVSSRARTPSAADFLTVDALAEEVRKLECRSRTFVPNERTKTVGRMPQSDDYVMSVRFLMCQSPEEIFFRPVLYDSRFEHLQAQLQISYRNVIRQTPCFKPGTWCTAYVYGQWIRAAILDFDENLQCSISSLDTGQLHRISVDQIYPLLEPYGFIPRLAIKCSLGGRPQVTDDAIAVSKISNALLLADEIFIYCRQRPRAISSNMAVSVVFRRRSDSSDVFINLNEVLQSEKQNF